MKLAQPPGTEIRRFRHSQSYALFDRPAGPLVVHVPGPPGFRRQTGAEPRWTDRRARWRLLTIAVHPAGHESPVRAMFFYFFFMVGTTLEAQWGTFRYNLFFLIGYVATVLVVLIPGAIVSNFI